MYHFSAYKNQDKNADQTQTFKNPSKLTKY